MYLCFTLTEMYCEGGRNTHLWYIFMNLAQRVYSHRILIDTRFLIIYLKYEHNRLQTFYIRK